MSSGIHGSSAIGYDSEDYCHAVNLHIEVSDAGRTEDKSHAYSDGRDLHMQLHPEQLELFTPDKGSAGKSGKSSEHA